MQKIRTSIFLLYEGGIPVGRVGVNIARSATAAMWVGGERYCVSVWMRWEWGIAERVRPVECMSAFARRTDLRPPSATIGHGHSMSFFRTVRQTFTLLTVGLLFQTLDTKVSRTIERANNRQRTLVSQGYHQLLLMSRLAKGRFCRPFLSFPLFHKNISRATTQKRQPVTPQDSSKQDRTQYGIPNKQRHGNYYQPRH
jgi:hypothetical protein